MNFKRFSVCVLEESRRSATAFFMCLSSTLTNPLHNNTKEKRLKNVNDCIIQ